LLVTPPLQPLSHCHAMPIFATLRHSAAIAPCRWLMPPPCRHYLLPLLLTLCH
jgi:hypothetical protein